MAGRQRSKSTKPAGPTRKRDSKGRFLPSSPKPKQKTLRLRDSRGRFLPVKPQPKAAGKKPRVPKRPTPKKPAKPVRRRVIKQGKDGRFRDESGRFVHVEMAPIKEGGHHDGRKNDNPRYRIRMTFQEAVDFYGFNDYEEMPTWVNYLAGAPGF